MENLLSLTSAQLRRAAEIKDTISRLDRELFSIFGVRSNSSPVAKKTRKMSAAARAKIAAAQRARWAKAKRKPAAKPAKARSRRKMSAAAKARLSALAKARWAKAKKAGKKSL